MSGVRIPSLRPQKKRLLSTKAKGVFSCFLRQNTVNSAQMQANRASRQLMRLFRSPFFRFRHREQPEKRGVLFTFLCSAKKSAIDCAGGFEYKFFLCDLYHFKLYMSVIFSLRLSAATQVFCFWYSSNPPAQSIAEFFAELKTAKSTPAFSGCFRCRKRKNGLRDSRDGHLKARITSFFAILAVKCPEKQEKTPFALVDKRRFFYVTRPNE